VYAALGTNVASAGLEDSLEGQGLEGGEKLENEKRKWICEGCDDLASGLSQSRN